MWSEQHSFCVIISAGSVLKDLWSLAKLYFVNHIMTEGEFWKTYRVIRNALNYIIKKKWLDCVIWMTIWLVAFKEIYYISYFWVRLSSMEHKIIFFFEKCLFCLNLLICLYLLITTTGHDWHCNSSALEFIDKLELFYWNCCMSLHSLF